MSDVTEPGPDAARTRVRSALAALEGCIDDAVRGGLDASVAGRLRTAFDRLSGALALGPEPAVRACPYCGSVGMRDAKLCGNCWTRLEPSQSMLAHATR